MNVIFLDIDGVLNTNNSELIEKRKVALLRLLIEKTGAVIVMSSGWKLWFDDSMKPVTEEALYLKNLFCEYGITIYDKTPDFSTEEIRRQRTFSIVKAKEIKAWLGSHKGIESYIVFDDLDLKDEDLRPGTILINNYKGLSEEDIDAAVKMLNIVR